MSKNSFWYGYLEAGEKSSAVLLDPGLDSGNRKTMLLFNLGRNQIIEYTRDIVAPKLRELSASESTLVSALESAYGPVRQNYTGTRRPVTAIPDSGPGPKASNEDDYEDLDGLDDVLEDDALDEDDKEE